MNTFTVDNEGKKTILFVVPAEDFNEMNYSEMRKVFIESGFAVEVVSSNEGECHGTYGEIVDSMAPLYDTSPDTYAAIVLVEGGGYEQFQEDRFFLNLIENAISLSIPICCLSTSSLVLAKAGLLDGRIISVAEYLREELSAYGVTCSKEDITVDGNIFSTDGSGSTVTEVAYQLVDYINSAEKTA